MDDSRAEIVRWFAQNRFQEVAAPTDVGSVRLVVPPHATTVRPAPVLVLAGDVSGVTEAAALTKGMAIAVVDAPAKDESPTVTARRYLAALPKVRDDVRLAANRVVFVGTGQAASGALWAGVCDKSVAAVAIDATGSSLLGLTSSEMHRDLAGLFRTMAPRKLYVAGASEALAKSADLWRAFGKSGCVDLGANWDGASVLTALAEAFPGATEPAPAGHYAYAADFTVHDARSRCQQIDIEENTSFSHGHGRVADGKYEILLNTSRHFLATPKLADFTLDFTASMRAHYWRDANIRDRLGLKIYFRWNRTEDCGDVLDWGLDNDRVLRVFINGRQIFERQEPMDAVVRTNDVFRLDVKGAEGVLTFNGTDVRFPLETAGVAGFVALDSHRAHSEMMKLSKLSLTSEAAPAKTHLRDYTFVLSQEQGFQEPLRFDVTLSRYTTGETEMSYKLGGTVAELGPRLKTGGSEWGRILERLTDPYLRIETEKGVYREVFLWNGMRQLHDPAEIRGARRENEGWPAAGRIVFRDFPETFTLAAGYDFAIVNPWRFAANGPWEQIQDATGKVLFEGGSVKGAGLAVRTTPKGGAAVLKRIPTDVPRYADVRSHVLKGGYFTASEPVGFALEACFRSDRWQASEVVLAPRFETVYGQPLADGAFDLTAPVVEKLEAGLVRVRQDVTLRKNPGCGVYKLALAGPDGKTTKTVLEVLSDDPNGPCPPLASGLPFLFSMPNECFNLEQSAFDPWNPFAGMSHYFSLSLLSPIVADSREVWRVLPAFGRSLWCWSWSRNTNDHDIYNDFNSNLIRHCGYFGGQDDRRRTQTGGSYDFASRWYDGDMIRWLAEFVRLHPGKFTRLNETRLAELQRRNGGVKFEDIREIFVAGLWEEYLAYVWPRTDKNMQDYVDYVLGLNPKAALATYGPFHVYVGRYKTAYTIRETGHPVEKDPRVRANGSFWVFEEYHHSCDYPIYRGALFAATYDLMCGYGRKLYPEIYYAGWGRCDDGAVFQAHPYPNSPLADTHQRKVVYNYTYGTPRFKDGAYGYWRDWGFHARNPEREAMDEFVYAWGKMLANKPVKSAKAAFLMTDPDAFVRHGDFFDDEYNPRQCFGVEPDVCNTAEEGLCSLYERAVAEGYTPPVVSLLKELDHPKPETTDYIALPPIVKGTPPETIAAIRRAYDRGINLFCTESCEGLEDLFGVTSAPVRSVRQIGDETFAHKLSRAAYAATDAQVTLWGAEHPSEKADIPLVFRRTGKAHTVFIALPPACVRKNRLVNHFHRGTDSISREMAREFRDVFAFLAPVPSVKAERGNASAAFTENGDLAVVLAEESPIYNDTETYPLSFRFTVRATGVGAAAIEADAPYAVVSRSPDEITLRTSTEKDTAHLFVFKGIAK